MEIWRFSLGNMVEESEFPSQAVMIFVWSSKKHVVLHYPNERLCSFYWLILDAFHWVLLSVSLTGSSTSWNWLFGFLGGAHYRGLLSNPTIYTTSPSLDEAFCVADGGSFRLSHDLFHSTLLNSIHFSLPVTIYIKNGTLSLHFSRESHVEIWSRRFFWLNLSRTQISKWLT